MKEVGIWVPPFGAIFKFQCTRKFPYIEKETNRPVEQLRKVAISEFSKQSTFGSIHVTMRETGQDKRLVSILYNSIQTHNHVGLRTTGLFYTSRALPLPFLSFLEYVLVTRRLVEGSARAARLSRELHVSRFGDQDGVSVFNLSAVLLQVCRSNYRDNFEFLTLILPALQMCSVSTATRTAFTRRTGSL